MSHANFRKDLSDSLPNFEMDEQSPLLPTHHCPTRARVRQLWRGHCLRANLSVCHTIHGAIREEIRSIFECLFQVKELVKCCPDTAFLCLLISCALICVKLLFARLEGILSQNSLVGGYLLINSVLEETGKLLWTWTSCAFDRVTQLCAGVTRCFLNLFQL